MDDFDLDEVSLEQMLLAEGEPSAATLARLSEGLVLVPHPNLKGYPRVDVAAGAPPTRAQLTGLSLLVLDELPTSDRRAWERLKRQPWFRAYVILGDLFHGQDHALLRDQPPALIGLMVDALIEGALVDPTANHIESATGPVWTAFFRCDLPAGSVFTRLWRLAEESHSISGYDSGSESIVIQDLVSRAPDAATAWDWRLRHALMSWAGAPSEAARTQRLREVLSAAEAAGVDVGPSAEACEAILYDHQRLPRSVGALDAWESP